jgi:hypothetical protein
VQHHQLVEEIASERLHDSLRHMKFADGHGNRLAACALALKDSLVTMPKPVISRPLAKRFNADGLNNSCIVPVLLSSLNMVRLRSCSDCC